MGVVDVVPSDAIDALKEKNCWGGDSTFCSRAAK